MFFYLFWVVLGAVLSLFEVSSVRKRGPEHCWMPFDKEILDVESELELAL